VPLLRCTRWALALTAAAIPLYVVDLRIGPIWTTPLEIVVVLTVALYAITAWRHAEARPRRTSYEIPIALFIVAGVIGTLVASNHTDAFAIFRQDILEPIAIFYIATAVLDGSATIKLLLAAWGAGSILFAGFEVLAFGSALAAGTLKPGDATAAFNMNPNTAALYLEPLIGLSAGLALFMEGRQRRAAIVVFCSLLIAELCTLSRGGLLALLMLAMVTFFTLAAPLGRIAIATATGFSALAATQLPVIGPRLSHVMTPAGTPLRRLDIWIATLRMLRDHPVLGSGLGSYKTVMAPYRAPDPLLDPQPYPHNIFLSGWTELGLLGMFAFGWIVIALAVRPWIAFARASGFPRALLWGSGAAFAMIITHGLVDNPYWKNNMSVEFWLIAALQVLALQAVRRSSVRLSSDDTEPSVGQEVRRSA